MNKINYQRELEKVLKNIENTKAVPRLFLHSCCAPCSSYVLEYLCKYFAITVFYYNPNISASEEYKKRAAEEKRLIEAYNREKKGNYIELIEGDYEPSRFLALADGLEECPEGGERCIKCFELRLRESALRAKEGNFDYFATTLTISPLKNADSLNKIGQSLAEEIGVPWLFSDFKKKNGYKRSIELSKQYGLYRQDYCGCAFSRAAREREAARRAHTLA